VAGLLYTCAVDRYGLIRPYIIGGAICHVRNMLRMQKDRGTVSR
jgi:hypothetical protein